jgi:perosamine synthetase
MSDVTAAIGVGQLEKLDSLLARRAVAAARYGELVAGIPGVSTLLPDDTDHARSWFVYPVRLDPSVDREVVIAALAAEGIQTSRYLPSIHLQPYMRERFGFTEGMCPVSEEASRRLLSLPFFTDISAGDQDRVADALARAL